MMEPTDNGKGAARAIFVFKAQASAARNSSFSQTAQRLRSHVQQMSADLAGTKLALRQRTEEVAKLRQSVGALQLELGRLRATHAEDTQQHKEEIEVLQRSVNNLRVELEHAKAAYDDCQDDLLEYEELKASYENLQADLQAANTRLRSSSASGEVAQARLKQLRHDVMAMSEHGARNVLMWVEETQRLRRTNALMLDELQAARAASAVCTVCSDARISTAFVPCGHCMCATCGAKLAACPVCRQEPSLKLRLFV